MSVCGLQLLLSRTVHSVFLLVRAALWALSAREGKGRPLLTITVWRAPPHSTQNVALS
jgi:hypothetical protein